METILVVEDDGIMGDNISDLLSHSGYRCRLASNGIDALKLLTQEKIDLIISDITMPQMNGFDFYNSVAKDFGKFNIPFIFLTARTDPDYHRIGMGLGADDYIFKPFKAKDLLRSIDIRLDKIRSDNRKFEIIIENISKYVPHELRTPLGAILGYSSLILSDKKQIVEDDLFEMVECIKKSGERLSQRIEKILMLTEIHIEEQEVKKDLDSSNFINEITEESISFTLRTIIHYYKRENDIKLNITKAKILITEKNLNIIINELVDNALKFSSPGTSVAIKGYPIENKYLIEITDKGIGLKTNEVQKLGEFRQFNKNLFQQEGNGLGLIIVNELVKRAGGFLKFDSNDTSSTKITITLNLN